jgi:hypothetical protein
MTAAKKIITRKTRTALTTRAPGRGFEEADKDSFAIPFLVLIQDKAKILEQVDAEPGSIINTATLKTYEALDVVPILYRRRFVRWAPRDLGGGFKGEFQVADVNAMITAGTVEQGDDDPKLYYPLPDGKINPRKCDHLSDTRTHFVLVEGKPAVINMASSQIRKSKNWMTALQDAGGDMWSNRWTLTPTHEKNDKGDWWGWSIEISGEPVTDEEKAAAEKFYQSIAVGIAKVDYSKAESGTDD